jgi:nicotinate-nucleotide adenylyltransferase
MTKQRIGIYAGVFDPVHSGHISFALQALSEDNLAEVYFLPERMPWYKPSTEHYGHRVAMLRQAIKPHDQLSLLELVDRRFSVQKTLPQLQRLFPDVLLTFLMGADVFTNIPKWQRAAQLVQGVAFVVAVRSPQDLAAVNATVALFGVPSSSVTIVDSMRPEVSSTKLRYAIRQNRKDKGLLMSVEKYARREWLYASVRQNV